MHHIIALDGWSMEGCHFDGWLHIWLCGIGGIGRTDGCIHSHRAILGDMRPSKPLRIPAGAEPEHSDNQKVGKANATTNESPSSLQQHLLAILVDKLQIRPRVASHGDRLPGWS